MEAKVLQPADRMTTAQCVIECSGYLRTIANQEFEGEDWQTAPKLRRQNLLTDFLCNLELSGEEFAELCGLIGFQLSKTTTAKLAKFTVIAYDWQGEANGEATPDILAALDKCEGVTLVEQRGYRPQARTYDLLRFHIAAFWRCLVNELRSLCLGVGLVVYPKEIPATPTETPRIVRVEIVRDFDKSYYANLYDEKGDSHNLSKEYTDFRTLKTLCKKEYGVNLPNLSQIEFETHGRKSYAYISTETPRISTETAETVNVSAEGENAAERAKCCISRIGGYKIIVGDREQGKVIAVLMAVNGHNTIEINDESAHIATMGEKSLQIDKPIMQLSDTEVLELVYNRTEPPQSPETPQTIKCTTDTPKPRETARKPQNRGIGNTRHSRLGANGYAMLDNASATLTAMCVPRECSTADASYW